MSLWKTFGIGQLDRVQGAALAMAPLIAALTGSSTKVNGVRTSDESILGDAIPQEVLFPGVVGRDSEDANTSVTIRMQTQDRSRKKDIFMRGIWDDLITKGGTIDQQNGLWFQQFSAFTARVLLDSWGWMGRDVSTTANITNYVSAADGTVSFTLDANLFPAPLVNTRQAVRISGLNNRSSILNGQQVVIATAVNAAKTVKSFGAGPFIGVGRMRFSTKTLILPQFINAVKVGERRVGAPFFRQRGRLRNRPVR
jgi:hypothetical protein